MIAVTNEGMNMMVKGVAVSGRGVFWAEDKRGEKLERGQRKRIKCQGLKSTKQSNIFQGLWKARIFRGRENGQYYLIPKQG